jgi:hypothetical protein
MPVLANGFLRLHDHHSTLATFLPPRTILPRTDRSLTAQLMNGVRAISWDKILHHSLNVERALHESLTHALL